MNITNYGYRSIATCIERMRSNITNTIILRYPYSEFDEGAEIANDREINRLYELLDRSITKDDTQKIYPLKIYEQRKNKSQPPLSNH